MQLFGKVVSPNRGGLNLNGNEELLINAKSNRITLSGSLLNKLDVTNKSIGFGYDPEGDLGSAPVYVYVMAQVEEGCKVGKSGTVTSKFHAEHIVSAFNNDTQGANRFKLDVNVKSPITHETGITLYPVTFMSTLADITRTKSTTKAEETAMDLSETNETVEDSAIEEVGIDPTYNTTMLD